MYTNTMYIHSDVYVLVKVMYIYIGIDTEYTILYYVHKHVYAQVYTLYNICIMYTVMYNVYALQ